MTRTPVVLSEWQFSWSPHNPTALWMSGEPLSGTLLLPYCYQTTPQMPGLASVCLQTPATIPAQGLYSAVLSDSKGAWWSCPGSVFPRRLAREAIRVFPAFVDLSRGEIGLQIESQCRAEFVRFVFSETIVVVDVVREGSDDRNDWFILIMIYSDMSLEIRRYARSAPNKNR